MESSPNVRGGLNRRQFLRPGVGAQAALAAGTALTRAASDERPRPNLLFVFSDQHSADMLGCYGNEQIRTPNLDRAASEGVRFNHCVSSYPVCTPYRAMLMTGQHPLYNGCFTNDVQLSPQRGPFLGTVLRDAGYRTGYVGKWHLHGGDRRRPIPAGPHHLGFDHMFLSNNCHLGYAPGKCFYWSEEGKQVFFDEWEVYGQTRQALQFLDDCRTGEPFALFVSWHPPHDWYKDKDGWYGYDTIPELMGLYDPANIKIRPNAEDCPKRRRQYQGYMAMCSGVDRAFGWLLEELKQKGYDRNTIVVFTADHGDMLGSHGAPGPKPYPENEATCVPFILRWPERLPTGRASDLLLGSLSLMPTLLGLMGLRIPDTCQGDDLSKAILEGRDNAVESVPLLAIGADYRGLYTKRHTYSFTKPRSGSTGHRYNYNTLYDRQNDPRQLRNLYEASEHRALRNGLHRLAQDWLDRFEDPFVDIHTLRRLCLEPKEAESRVLCRPGLSGILRGRPIDLLKDAGLVDS